MLTKSYRKAQAVLMAFEDMYGDVVRGDVSFYSNCREQGFAITFYDWDACEGDSWVVKQCPPSQRVTALFSENRNSDDIVIYLVPAFQPMPTDEEHKARELFSPNEYSQAAKYIWNRLTRNGVVVEKNK